MPQARRALEYRIRRISHFQPFGNHFEILIDGLRGLLPASVSVTGDHSAFILLRKMNNQSESESTTRPGSSNVMYTPRTPRMRQRQRFDLSTKPEEDGLDGLEELIGQTWNIYAASALFGFQQDDVHFKLYSKKLREEVASTLSHENVTYSAKFSVVENIVSGPNEDHPAIKIEVTAETNDREKDVKKQIYKGILLSWRITQTESNIENSIRLPLLLCRGTRSCMNAVHAIIGRMFDCLVIALPANEDDLSWLIPIIIMVPKADQRLLSGEVQMEYTVPELPVTDIITVKFHTSDLKKILSTITKDQDDRVNVSLDHEHIEMFFEVLHKQMLTLGGLQLGLCTLHRINLPGITITENRPELVATLKRTAETIFNTGGFIRKIENCGVKTLPCKTSIHGHVHHEANHFFIYFDVPPQVIDKIIDIYHRDIDIVRLNIFKQSEPINKGCTFHEEMLPPPYRPGVQKLMDMAKKQRHNKHEFKYNTGLDYYPFNK